MYSHVQFAIASALATASALAMGQYTTPFNRGFISQYTMFIAGASGGKEHYSSRVKSIVRASAPERLVKGSVASAQAINAQLFECNARLMVHDEGLQWISRMMTSRSTFEQAIKEHMLTLWGMSDPVLDGMITKDKSGCSPSIVNPSWAFVGSGTTEDFETLLRSGDSVISSGFASRFDFVFADRALASSFVDRPQWDLAPELRERFTYIANRGEALVPSQISIQPAERQIVKRIEILNPKAVAWSDEVKYRWNSVAVAMANAPRDRLLTSIYNRASEKILRVASVLAIVECPENPVITLPMLEWAIQWQNYLSQKLSRICVEKVGQSKQSEVEQEIMRLVGKGIYSFGRWCDKCALIKHSDISLIKAAVESLVLQGTVTMVQDGVRNRPSKLAVRPA
jgi:hypothetical protein